MSERERTTKPFLDSAVARRLAPSIIRSLNLAERALQNPTIVVSDGNSSILRELIDVEDVMAISKGEETAIRVSSAPLDARRTLLRATRRHAHGMPEGVAAIRRLVGAAGNRPRHRSLG